MQPLKSLGTRKIPKQWRKQQPKGRKKSVRYGVSAWETPHEERWKLYLGIRMNGQGNKGGRAGGRIATHLLTALLLSHFENV